LIGLVSKKEVEVAVKAMKNKLAVRTKWSACRGVENLKGWKHCMVERSF